ncbi:MAG: MotA/TolQ/ExbB proton channel family protein [Candidatus Nealsonbacteria bacterium]|nr:MotA/TolQ/ExbB proton channel family protein [Candidatus Nealsonbacteria bacterium]
MKIADSTTRRALLRSAILLIPLAWMLAVGLLLCGPVLAQANGAAPPEPPSATDAAEAGPSAETGPAPGAAPDETTQPGDDTSAEENSKATGSDAWVQKKINYWELLLSGGWLMLPIAFMSLLVVTFGVERALGLRRGKVLPPELIGGLGQLAGQKGGLNPRSAYKLCQQFPSAAANVIKTMLLKVGRPHTELEHAVSEANEREAARLYANVRWLSLGAGVAPLMGLLGTVWGMIEAFFATANPVPGAVVNKAQFLADGIYVALVTTFAGLSVAIPAAVLAHLYEGRIQSLFRELDETLMGMMPQLERFEGRLRVSKEQMDVPVAEAATETPAAKPAVKPAEAPAATPK